MIQSEVVYLWIHLARGVALIDFILTLVLRDIITITTSILIRGVKRDIYLRSSRNPNLLYFMER